MSDTMIKIKPRSNVGILKNKNKLSAMMKNAQHYHHEAERHSDTISNTKWYDWYADWIVQNWDTYDDNGKKRHYPR